jgi:8-oxo-dGTP diphosphatase
MLISKYTEEGDFMMLVCAAIIYDKGKFLIAQRKENSQQGLKWEFPGGKVEEGESPEECIIREIQEELNINIEVSDVFDVVYHTYDDKSLVMIVYNCIYESGTIEKIDCNDFRWVTESELHEFEFANADKKVVTKLTKTM